MKTRVLYIIAPLLLLCVELTAQVKSWEFLCEDVGIKTELAVEYANKEFGSIEEAKESILKTVNDWQSEGFLEANLDSIHLIGTKAVARIHKGNEYRLKHLGLECEDMNVFKNLPRPNSNKPSAVFSSSLKKRYEESVLLQAAEMGFPVGKTEWELVDLNGGELTAILRLEKGPSIVWDSLRVSPESGVSRTYLQKYLDVQPGKLYKQSTFTQAQARLKSLQIASPVGPPQLEIKNDKATLSVNLRKAKASSFDLLLGVLPNNEITGRLVLSGQGELNLVNAFSRAEEIHLKFQKLEAATKRLEASLFVPYLPGVNLGLSTGLDIHLQDSLFLDREFNLGVRQLFRADHYVELFAVNKRSALLSADTALVIQQKALPDLLDFGSWDYGLRYKNSKLDRIRNPRSGWLFDASASLGVKTIKSNALITELSDPLDPAFDFGSLYDSLDESVFRSKFTALGQYFQALGKRSTVLVQVQSKWLSDKDAPVNDLYRIGGPANLRGLDDRSLPVSHFQTYTLEYRLLGLLGPLSRVHLMSEWTYVERISLAQKNYSNYLGFGAGITFPTRSGSFSLQYALANRQGDPIQFRNAKVHFGYLNYF